MSELWQRAEELRALLTECTVCPHTCRTNRLGGSQGLCQTTSEVIVSSASAHFGEEPPLVGTRGSGTIFFSSCNLHCAFCQNFEISHLRMGNLVSAEELAGIMLALQHHGCHNINLVTPTHYTPQIVESLCLAVERGLTLPLVYNCGGYESTHTLVLLENIVDIYMPDIKYSDNAVATALSGAPGYWDVVRAAVKEMHRQVGDLAVAEDGVARRGLLVRHLVLPGRRAGSQQVLEFIAADLSPDTYVNIMDQYRPAFLAAQHPGLNRTITSGEYEEVLWAADRLGLHRGFDVPSGHYSQMET